MTVLSAAEHRPPADLELVKLIASPVLQAMLVYPDANNVQIQYELSFAPAGIGLNDNQTSLGGYFNNVISADPTSLPAITGALLAATSNGYTARRSISCRQKSTATRRCSTSMAPTPSATRC